jgi:hypothetical protein
VLEVLIVAGFHVPEIAGLLPELGGSDGGVELRHNGPICVKVGVTCELTSIRIVVEAAHCPGAGVKV